MRMFYVENLLLSSVTERPRNTADASQIASAFSQWLLQTLRNYIIEYTYKHVVQWSHAFRPLHATFPSILRQAFSDNYIFIINIPPFQDHLQ